MTSSAKSENVDLLGNAIDVAMLEAEFRKDKAKAKSNFTQARNNLLLMVDYQSLPSRSGIRDACYKMDMCMEIVMDVLSSLTTFHLQNKELQKGIVVVSEMEKIETDFCAAYEIAWAYLDSRGGEKSTDVSDCLSIDLEGQNSIKKNAETDTYRKQMETNQTLDKVGTLDQLNILDSNPLDMSVEHRATNHCIEAEQNIVNTEKPSQNATTFVPTDNLVTPNIGHDLWTQLKHVQIPTFSGDKRTYPSWKAAFMACVDIAPVTPEYKMLQLRQYVSGEALNTVEHLGYSSTAYEAAKDRLERKYGGKRRRKAIFLEDLEQFRQIQSGNTKELERFADLLDMTVINLKDAGEHRDLGDGCLYIQLQRKLPQSLLAKYHRWLFENNVTESVVALKTWVIQESHFQTIASETVYGLTGKPLISSRRSRHRILKKREHSSYPQDPVNRNKYSHATYVENNTDFGNVSYFCRKRYQSAGRSQKDYRFAIAAWQKGITENHAEELDDAVKMAVLRYIIDCYMYIKNLVVRQFSNQNQMPNNAAPIYNIGTREQKILPRITTLSARRGIGTQDNELTLSAHILPEGEKDR